MPSTIDKSSIPIRILLSVSLYQHFEAKAQAQNTDITEVIARHLVETRDQSTDSGRSLKISSEQRQSLERHFGRSFQDGNELCHFLEQTYSVRLTSGVGQVADQCSVPISPDLLRRLEGRRGRMEFRPFIIETIIRQLEHFVGMR